MITFREFLQEKDVYNFYIQVDDEIRRIQSFDKAINSREDFVILEAIIEPALLKIKSDISDIDSINDEFKSFKIFFTYGNDLSGYYKQKEDEIHISILKNSPKSEIEAMIGHELIHREQNKRSGVNYLKQAEKWYKEVNKLALEFNKSQDTNILDQYRSRLDYFTKNNPYEQMAYAYQVVKENPNYSPSDVVNFFKTYGFTIDVKLKKYIGMYYLIRNKL